MHLRRAINGTSVPEPREGKIVFYLLLVFTLFLLARPQDFINVLKAIPIVMMVGIPAIALYFLSLLTGQLRFRNPTEQKLMFALTFWLMAGIPFSYWRSNSLQLFTDEWLKTLIIFFLLCQTLNSLHRVRRLLWTIFFSGLIATGLSLVLGGAQLSSAIDSDTRYMGMVQGFFGGNYLGIAAAVIIPYMAVMMIHTRAAFKVLLLLASFGTMIWMAVLTASRGNIISIVASLILTWALILRASLKARLIGVILVVGLAGSVLAAPRAFWERVGAMWDPTSYATSSVTMSASASEYQRKEVFVDSLVYTMQHPIFGLGMGNFPIAHGTDKHNPQEWKGTHNTFTQFSSEGGIPAFILYVSLLWVVISRMRTIARCKANTPELAQLRALALATIVSVLSFGLGGVFAHLAYAYYVYYLAAIGVGIQNTVVLLPTAGNGRLPPQNGSAVLRNRTPQEIRP